MDLPDSAVMGIDSVGELKQMKADRERKRSEREFETGGDCEGEEGGEGGEATLVEGEGRRRRWWG